MSAAQAVLCAALVLTCWYRLQRSTARTALPIRAALSLLAGGALAAGAAPWLGSAPPHPAQLLLISGMLAVQLSSMCLWRRGAPRQFRK